MKSYSIPKNFNGYLLRKELEKVNIFIEEIIIHDDKLWLDTDNDLADEIVANYKGKTLKQEQAEAEAKEAQRQAILDRLGITADEAKLILG